MSKTEIQMNDIGDDSLETDELMQDETIALDFRVSHNSLLNSKRKRSRREGRSRESDESEFTSLSVWTKMLELKKYVRQNLMINFCQCFLQIVVLILLVCAIVEAVNYIQEFAGKLSQIDWDAFAKVSKELKNVDFEEWNRDLNDIQTIKNTVAGYGYKVNQITNDVKEMLRIMKEVEKYINGSIPGLGGLIGGGSGGSGGDLGGSILKNLNISQILDWWKHHQSGGIVLN